MGHHACLVTVSGFGFIIGVTARQSLSAAQRSPCTLSVKYFETAILGLPSRAARARRLRPPPRGHSATRCARRPSTDLGTRDGAEAGLDSGSVGYDGSVFIADLGPWLEKAKADG